jgi:DnaJ-class molecular chaperone
MQYMPNKDYYDILGVARTADPKEIHKAYRRKARELHPDKNKGDSGAEDKFKDLGEAYRILSDPQKRKQYDLFGSVGGDYAPPPGWSQPPPGYSRDPYSGGWETTTESAGFEDLFEALMGRFSRGTRGRPRDLRMEAERGSDVEVELPLTIEDLLVLKPKQIRISNTRRCEACEGMGRAGSGVCSVCKGSGKVTQRKTLRIRIPAGVNEGTIVRLTGQGNPSPDGIGVAGDLLIRLRIKPHPRFRIVDGTLEMDLEVPDYQAALGEKIEFDTPTGRLAIQLPAGTTTGKKLKIRGKGLLRKGGSHGDLLVNVIVTVPSQLTEEQKELYERLKNVKE